MNSSVRPPPALVMRIFALGWFLLAPCRGADMATVSRVWQVSPDFWVRDAREEKPEGAQTDPFGTRDYAGANRPTDPARLEDYPSTVPALGPLCPRDLRPVLRNLGVTFREGDLALYSIGTGELPILFVRASRQNIDLVDFLMEAPKPPERHVEATFLLRRRHKDGTREDLVRRTFLCQSGHEAQFQRHRGGILVEEEDAEATVSDDGVTIEMNVAVEFHVKEKMIKTATQTLLRSGEPGVILYSTGEKGADSTLEVELSAKRVDFPSIELNPGAPQSDLGKLAARIEAQLREIETKPGATGRRGELIAIPDIEWMWRARAGEHFLSIRDLPSLNPAVKIESIEFADLRDITSNLKELMGPSPDLDRALYSRDEILYVHAGEAAIRNLSRYSLDSRAAVTQMEIGFSSWSEDGKMGERHDYAPRSLMVRCGQSSTSIAGLAVEGQESTKVTAQGGHGNPQADLELSLCSWRMGDERWTLKTRTTTTSDGTFPVTIVSGTSGDAGGVMKRLTVSSRIKYDRQFETLRDPAKRKAAVVEIEAVLSKPGGLKLEPPGEPAGSRSYALFEVPDFPRRGDEKDEWLKKLRAYPHIIPALGVQPPLDVRDVFKSLGVVFKKGDVALSTTDARETPLVFVRADPDQIDLVETVMEPMGSGPPKHAGVTYVLRQRSAEGVATDLVRRTVVCRGGQQAMFSRSREGKLREKENLEITIGEDGVTIDLNSNVAFHLEDAILKAEASTLHHSGDREGDVLCMVPGKSPGSVLQLLVSAKRAPQPYYRIGGGSLPESYLQHLGREINETLTAIEAGAAPENSAEAKWADLYYIRDVTRLGGGKDPDAVRLHSLRKTEIDIPREGRLSIVDLKPQLQMKLQLENDDALWYSPGTGLLYIKAGPAARAMVADACTGSNSAEARQLSVLLESWKEAGNGQPRQDYAGRSIVLMSGQRATATTEEKPGPPEKLEVEGFAGTAGNISDLNLSLASLRMEEETWSLASEVLVEADGNSPAALVSGTALDAGGRMTHLAVRSKQLFGRWRELIMDVERRKAAIAAIESAIGKK